MHVADHGAIEKQYLSSRGLEEVLTFGQGQEQNDLTDWQDQGNLEERRDLWEQGSH